MGGRLREKNNKAKEYVEIFGLKSDFSVVVAYKRVSKAVFNWETKRLSFLKWSLTIEMWSLCESWLSLHQ